MTIVCLLINNHVCSLSHSTDYFSTKMLPLILLTCIFSVVYSAAVDPACFQRPSLDPACARSDPCICPNGWAMNPVLPIFKATCFRFLSNPLLLPFCTSRYGSQAVGICQYPQLISLPRCTVFSLFAQTCDALMDGSIPIGRNGEWRCVRFENVVLEANSNNGGCPVGTFAQCMVITAFITELPLQQ